MKKLTHVLSIISLIILCSSVALSRIVASGASNSGVRRYEATLVEEVLQAHGGRKSIASISGFRVGFAKLTYTSPFDFFERQVRISSDGEQFTRETIHPDGKRRRYEVFDGRGSFQVEQSWQDENGDIKRQPFPADSYRLRDVRFSIETSGLIPLLRRLSLQQTNPHFLERTPQMLDRFEVTTPDGRLIISVDQSRLIRRLEVRDISFQFADYHATGGLMLPRIQRVVVGQRLVQELFFSEVNLDRLSAKN